MRIRLLGELGVDRDGLPVAVTGPQARRLLALLATHPGRNVPVEQMVDVLFPDGLAEGSRSGNVRTYVFRLRALVGDGAVVTTSNGYRLEVDPAEVDTERFSALVRRAMTGPTTTAVAVLDEALGLWPSGRAYAELADEEWCRGEATRLEELRWTALERRAEMRLESAPSGDVVAELEALVVADPLRERLWALLMLGLYRTGRQVEALRLFQQYRHQLAEQTGLEPGPSVVALERKIAAHDPSLLSDVDDSQRRLRGYVLEEKIGAGAFGVVFRASQPLVGREVAVKVARAELADDPAFVRRFDAEAQIIASLEHAHIVPVHDFWREPGGAFLVMRYLRGGSVGDVLSGGPSSLELTRRVVDAVASALAFAHRRGVVHGDVKPSNILFDDNGDVFVTDFGLAGPSDHVGPRSASDDQRALARVAMDMLGADRDVSVAVESVLTVANHDEPGERFASMDDFLHAWTAAVTGTSAVVKDLAALATNPFKGLRFFGEADAADFFGRDTLVEELVDAVAARRFLAVVGPSGSGKSSLIRAGVVPRLRGQGMFVATMTPGPRPFEQLESALLGVAVTPLSNLRDRLTAEGGIADAVARIVPDGPSELVLVIDQLEEVWTQVDPDERTMFLTNLMDAVVDADSRVRIVVVLRADFYDRPLDHDRIAGLLQGGTFLVTPLAAGELAEAITAPATRQGIRTDPALVARIVTDAVSQPGSLPLVQYCLTELFDRRQGDLMTAESYESIGGLTGSLARTADSLTAGFELDAVRRLFSRLVAVGDDATTDTRRKARRSELAMVPATLIDRYAAHRLLTFDRDADTREPTVEIAHDSLLRAWSRLADWIEEDRQGLRVLRHLTDTASAWEIGGRRPDELYRGTRLAAADEYARVHPDMVSTNEAAFVNAGTQRARRVRRVQRLAVTTMAVLLIVALFTAGVAIVQRSRARSARAQQATVATTAEIRRLALEARTLASTQPALGLLLASEAYRRLPDDIDTQGAVEAALVTNPQLESIISMPPGDGAFAAVDNGDVVEEVDGRLTRFDLTHHSQQTVDVLPGHPQSSHVELWPDATTLAVPVNDQLHLLDLRTGHDVAAPIPLGKPAQNFGTVGVTSHVTVRLSDGRLAVGVADGLLLVSPDGTSSHIALPFGPSPVGAASAAPILVTAPFFGSTLAVVDASSGTVSTLTIPLLAANDVAVDAQGTRIVAGAPTGEVVLLDRSGKVLAQRRLTAFVGFVYLADGRIAASLLSGQVRILDPDTLETREGPISLPGDSLQRVVTLDAHRVAVPTVAGLAVLNRDGRSVLATVADFYGGAPSPDGTHIATVARDGTLTILDARTLAPQAAPWLLDPINPTDLYYIAWSPDQSKLALRTRAPGVQIIDIRSGAVTVAPTPGPSAFIGPVSFSPDGRHLAIPIDQGGVELVDVASLEVVATHFEAGWGFGLDVTYSPDGTRIIVGPLAGKEPILEASSLKPLLTCEAFAGHAAYSPDGKTIAIKENTGDVALLDAATCRRRGTLTGSHTAGRVIFSLDGRQVIARSLDGIRMWDIATGRQIGDPLPDPTDSFLALGFTSGRLASAAADELLSVFDLDPAIWFSKACATAGRNLTRDEWNRYVGRLGAYRATCTEYPVGS